MASGHRFAQAIENLLKVSITNGKYLEVGIAAERVA
jgi:3-dehydroquinate synthetase